MGSWQNIKDTIKSSPIYKNSGLKKIGPYLMHPRRAIFVHRLMRDIEAGDLATLQKYTYKDLFELKAFCNAWYRPWLEKLHTRVAQSLAKAGRPLRFCFVVTEIPTWLGDRLYSFFAEDPRFDVEILLVPLKNGSQEFDLKQARAYFEERKFPYRNASPDTTLQGYDIVLTTRPYLYLMDADVDTDSIPLSTLVTTTPYGIHVLIWSLSAHWDLPINMISWRNFSHVSEFSQLAETYCRIGSYGMRYTGYTKMDAFYLCDTARINTESLWKTPVKDTTGGHPLRIIWAPHHSIEEVTAESKEAERLGTFPQNYEFLYEYAKTHPDTTSWVLKPHPNLRAAVVEQGIFSSQAEYDAWLDCWRALPNARVELSTYVELFLSSDCMIFDSGSFIAEYLYAHKPALFLTREGTRFYDWARRIVEEMQYHVPGSDHAGIAHFIETVCKEDPHKAKREAYFREKLDYYSKNGMLASDAVYQEIVKSIFEPVPKGDSYQKEGIA